jgi:3-phenylpropionate/trans-cinnamate dioxygenase ferredoxin subunit
MGKVTALANTSDLAEGAMKKYKIQDQEILVARIEGKYCAVQNKCPHFGGDLSQGKLEGTVVTCPKHGSQFNIIDGSVVRWLKGTGIVSSIGKTLKSPQKLITYNLKLDGQYITVEI